jgi:hypothetical protein
MRFGISQAMDACRSLGATISAHLLHVGEDGFVNVPWRTASVLFVFTGVNSLAPWR